MKKYIRIKPVEAYRVTEENIESSIHQFGTTKINVGDWLAFEPGGVWRLYTDEEFRETYKEA